MENQNQPKKHHFVPECYLEKFSDNGNIYRFDPNLTHQVKKPILNRKNISGICYYEDFYTIDDNIPDKDEFLSMLGDVLGIEKIVNGSWENKYDSMLDQLLTGNLTRIECVEFSEFIIHLKLRNPFYLESIIKPNKDKWLEQTGIEIADEMEKDSRYNYLTKEDKTMFMGWLTERAKNQSAFSKRIQLTLLLHRWSSIKEGAYIDHMIDCGWQIMVAPDPHEFVTSDNPGYTLELSSGNVQNTKFTDGFAFHFPLTSKYCLLITDDIPKSEAWNKSGIKEISKRFVTPQMLHLVNFLSMQKINKIVLSKSKLPMDNLAECVLLSD